MTLSNPEKKLRSSTWLGRNEDAVELIIEELGGKTNLRLCFIGAGAVSCIIKKFHPPGSKHSFGVQQKLLRFSSRIVDDFLRKHELYSNLISFEVEEIVGAIGVENIEKVFVLDIDERVLSAVNDASSEISKIVCDINNPGNAIIDTRPDLIICHNVLKLQKDINKAFSGLVKACDLSGGVISLDNETREKVKGEQLEGADLVL